jgi:hypothetical protein
VEPVDPTRIVVFGPIIIEARVTNENVVGEFHLDFSFGLRFCSLERFLAAVGVEGRKRSDTGAQKDRDRIFSLLDY